MGQGAMGDFMMIRFLCCVFLGFGLLASGSAYSAAAQGYVHEIRGDVQAVVGSGQSVKLEKNQSLPDNTTVTTGTDSHAIIKFIDGTVIALNQNTSFTIQKFDYNEKSPSTMTAFFSMLRGGLRVVTGAMSQRNREGFRLATPNSTIGIRGTEFMLQQVNPTIISVLSGITSMNNVAGTVSFSAGQFGFAGSSTTLPVFITELPPNVLTSFNYLQGLNLPPATPNSLPQGGGPGNVNPGVGGMSGGVVGGVAGAAAAAAAIAGGGSSSSPVITNTQ